MTSTASPAHLQTPLCPLLNIKYPILLAGMAHTSNGALAAAVSNAGGLGVIGGFSYPPATLLEMIQDLKSRLTSPSLPFGVDLALPHIGDGARKTNTDYTNGQLDALIDIVISEGAKLFVSALGIPPPHIITRLHTAGILIMNMIGAPRHAEKALQAGVDIVCSQGAEAGGHTGDIPSSILLPAVLDVARGYTSPLTGKPAMVIAAGGIYDGRGLAASLVQGAMGVWVGTRFVASEEAGSSRAHKNAVVQAGYADMMTTLVVSGRPLRVRRNEYLVEWEEKRRERMRELLDKGIVPMAKDLDDGVDVDIPFLMGQVAAVIKDVKPAGVIVEDMVREAVELLKRGNEFTCRPMGSREAKL